MNEIFENWQEAKSVLLEGLTPEKQAILAPLLENQKNYVLSEAAAGGSGGAGVGVTVVAQTAVVPELV